MAHGKWWAITSFFLLFAASYATAQTPTPIRSVASLPATCKGGSATQSSDMVVLITGGIGTTYICDHTDHWTMVQGTGGTGTPGGSNGQPQFNDNTAFNGSAGELMASAFPGVDICTSINNAMSALPSTGGIITVSAGNYSACSTTIAITKNSVTLQGSGWLNQLVSPTGAATTLNFAAGVTGIDITGNSVTVKNLNLLSADVGANTDDGIRVRGNPTTLERISISHFGRNGVLTLGNFPTNADTWHYTNLQSYQNYGDGYQWGTPCTDNHLGIGDLLIASVNGGWGFNMLCGVDNTINSPLAQANVLGGYNVEGSYNTFNQVYCEGGTGSSFVLHPESPSFVSSTRVTFNAFGQCDTIGNVGATAPGNRIEYFGVDNWLVQNGLWISGEPGSTGNKSYHLSVGDSTPSQLSLVDVTDASANLFTYDPTNKWVFNQPVRFAAGAVGAGGSAGVDFQTVTSYTIPSSDAGSIVAGYNSSPIAWTGPALTNNINFTLFNVSTGLITYTPSSGFVNGAATQIIPYNWSATHYTDGFNTIMTVNPTIGAFPDCQDSTGNHLNFNAATGAISCGNTAGPAAGDVTHSAGPLTAGNMAVGNGAGDLTVDSSVSTDGAGNMSVTSVQTTGINGGFTGVEGDCSGLTPGPGIDTLCAKTGVGWVLNNSGGGDVKLIASGGDINTSDQVTATHLSSALPVNQGGTGSTTGHTAAGIVSLFTSCSGTQYLGADGNCHTNGGQHSGFCVGTVGTGNGSTYFWGVSAAFSGNPCTATGNNAASIPMGVACTAKNLYAVAFAAGGQVTSGVVTVYKNTTATAITCTLGTGTSCNDTSHTASFTAGDLWQFAVTTGQATDTTSYIRATFTCE